MWHAHLPRVFMDGTPVPLFQTEVTISEFNLSRLALTSRGLDDTLMRMGDDIDLLAMEYFGSARQLVLLLKHR
jgi:hypothetical protein